MLVALLFVLVGIAVGDMLAAAISVPVPGPVLGLLAAAGYFASRGGPSPAMGAMFDAVIPYAPMLFVPAGAGLVANLDLIGAHWLPIAAAITVGTAGALLVTGFAAQFLLRRMSPLEVAS